MRKKVKIVNNAIATCEKCGEQYKVTLKKLGVITGRGHCKNCAKAKRKKNKKVYVG